MALRWRECVVILPAQGGKPRLSGGLSIYVPYQLNTDRGGLANGERSLYCVLETHKIFCADIIDI